jgi:serine/threonine protein kinase
MLPTLISSFHIFIVIVVLLLPFSNIPSLLLLHFVFSFSLITHWYFNNNICSLSLMESKLRGIKYTTSFTHQFIAPIYNISTTQWSNICYIIVILLMSISLYKLIKSKVFEKCINCFKQTRNIKCFLPLFVI